MFSLALLSLQSFNLSLEARRIRDQVLVFPRTAYPLVCQLRRGLPEPVFAGLKCFLPPPDMLTCQHSLDQILRDFDTIEDKSSEAGSHSAQHRVCPIEMFTRISVGSKVAQVEIGD